MLAVHGILKKNTKTAVTSPTNCTEQDWRYLNPPFQSMSSNIEAIPHDTNHLSAIRKGKPGWTNETTINLYQRGGKAKVWMRKGCVQDRNHTSSSVRRGAGRVMTWTCMAIIHDGIRIISEVYRNTVPDKCIKTRGEASLCSKIMIQNTQQLTITSSDGKSGRFWTDLARSIIRL